MKVTKKSLLQTLQTGEVKATMVGGNAIEDWPDIVEKVKRTYPDAVEEDTGIYFGNEPGTSKYIMKPRIHRVRQGRISVKGSKYSFVWNGQESSGNVADLKLLPDGSGLELTMFNGALLQYQPAA